MLPIARSSSLYSTFLASLVGLAVLSHENTALAQITILTPTENNLYNTGFNGTTLAGNNQLDTHYTISNFGTGQTFQANPLAGGWAANPPDSQWITVSSTGTVGPA